MGGMLEVDASFAEAGIEKANQGLLGEVQEIACAYEAGFGEDGLGGKGDSAVDPSLAVPPPSAAAGPAALPEPSAELQAGFGEDGFGGKRSSAVDPPSAVPPPSSAAGSIALPEKSAEGLQALYASAYGGWIGPPGAGEEVVYLSPTGAAGGTGEGQPGTPREAWVEAALELADQHGGLFGLTAFNPLGQDTPHTENLAKDKLLEEDVMELCAKTGGSWWRAFGFADGWHEMGFTVAAPQDKMVELAKKYEQAAVYRFSRNHAPGADAPFLRATVPALLRDTESEVPVSPVAKPSLERADPSWQPGGREALLLDTEPEAPASPVAKAPLEHSDPSWQPAAGG